MTALYAAWIEKYPIVSIEDGLAENDWEGYRHHTTVLGSKIQIVGDDIYVTNKKFISRGIAEKTTNAVLIKLNQIGTVTETIEAIELCKKAGWGYVISHRSGETEDTFMADFAVAMGGGQIKTGAPCRSERVAKYNRLLEIESELGVAACYGGTL
jgi:enolase